MLLISTMTNIDYAATYFKYPVPSPINVEPTNKTLKRLKTELHAREVWTQTSEGSITAT